MASTDFNFFLDRTKGRTQATDVPHGSDSARKPADFKANMGLSSLIPTKRTLVVITKTLHAPPVICFWIVVLLVDMSLLFVFIDRDVAWYEVFSNVVSSLFAADLALRMCLHKSLHGHLELFWRDRFNILDAFIVIVDITTSILSIIITSGVNEGGAVKGARMLRLVRLARTVRLLRLRRAFALLAENTDWILYQIDQRLHEAVWKTGSLTAVFAVCMVVLAALFYSMEPEPTIIGETGAGDTQMDATDTDDSQVSMKDSMECPMFLLVNVSVLICHPVPPSASTKQSRMDNRPGQRGRFLLIQDHMFPCVATILTRRVCH